MPPIRDPRADFEDDGGTPGWRARHAPPVIDVYPNRRAAFRDLMRRQPLIGLHFGIILSIALYLFLGVEIAAFLTYGLICRLLGNG